MPGMGPMGPGGGPGGFGGPGGHHGGPHGHGPMGPMGGPMMGPGGPMGPMGPGAVGGPGFFGVVYRGKQTAPTENEPKKKSSNCRKVKVLHEDGSIEERVIYINPEYERWKKTIPGRVTLWFRRTFRRR